MSTISLGIKSYAVGLVLEGQLLMNIRKNIVLAVVASLVVSGCATSRNEFIRKGYSLDKLDFCQNYVKDYQELQKFLDNIYSIKSSSDRWYLRTLDMQVKERGLSIYECKRVVEEHRDSVAEGVLAAAALIVVAAAVIAVSEGVGSGGLVEGGQTDNDYDWDYQPRNDRWVCRGTTTGQYAELSNCKYDLKDDSRWPG